MSGFGNIQAIPPAIENLSIFRLLVGDYQDLPWPSAGRGCHEAMGSSPDRASGQRPEFDDQVGWFGGWFTAIKNGTAV